MATLLTVDNHVTKVEPKNSKEFTLVELQGFVGGYIEMVPTEADDVYLVINKEGKLVNLPANELATALVKNVLRPGDYIAGDALLATLKELGE